MKYLFLLYRNPDVLAEPGTPEATATFTAYQEVNDAMREAGVYRDCQPLQPRSASTVVKVRGGETLITDGPSAEIKEQVGGYAVIECTDLDEALRWASRIPAAKDSSVEVRPVVAMAGAPV